MSKKKKPTKSSALLEEAISDARQTGKPFELPYIMEDSDEVDLEAEHAWELLLCAWWVYRDSDVPENIRKQCENIIRRIAKAAHLRTPGRPAIGDDPVELEPFVKDIAPDLQKIFKEYRQKKGQTTSPEEMLAAFAKVLANAYELGPDIEERMKNIDWESPRIQGLEKDLLVAMTGRPLNAVRKALQPKRRKKDSK